MFNILCGFELFWRIHTQQTNHPLYLFESFISVIHKVGGVCVTLGAQATFGRVWRHS